MQLEVTVEYSGWDDLIPAVDELAREALGAAAGEVGFADPAAEVSLLFADDASVRRLNRDWRGKDTPTNVLSFEADEEEGPATGPRLLGDIVLAFETVMREAREQHKRPEDHTRHLLAHGFLHLLGYDHQDAAEAERMEAHESAALARLGVADPYAEDRRGSEGGLQG